MEAAMEGARDGSPLKPIELHVLLALSERPQHGYALAARVRELSEQRLRLLPGNLYVVLHRLAERGLLRETDGSEAGAGADSRKRTYELTAGGRSALRDELSRLDGLLRSAAARRALAGRGGGKR
jgi:DNA-binding PadR family transcriptional regulator